MRKEGGVLMICDVDTGTVDEIILLSSSYMGDTDSTIATSLARLVLSSVR